MGADLMTVGTDRLRIVVLGYIVRWPLGGAWHHLQYVLGLHELGHDVVFVEDSGPWPEGFDPDADVVGPDCSYGIRFAERAFDSVGLGGRWAYFDEPSNQWSGPLSAVIDSVLSTCDVMIDLSGVNPLRPWMERVPVRVLVDTDPGFTQLRNIREGARRADYHHTAFFTFGELIGQPQCRIPDDGLPWQPTRQPVVLHAWRVTPPPARRRFTTIMMWDSYEPIAYEGHTYGMKSASFPPYLAVPGRVGVSLELAVGGPSAPREELRSAGWVVTNPVEITKSLESFRAYVEGSTGEFSLAKHGYVEGRTGWFSERTACYLASGRPAIVQDTGFTQVLPADTGLVGFSTPDEAVTALATVLDRYEEHCTAARDIATSEFDSGSVLTKLLSDAMVERHPAALATAASFDDATGAFDAAR